MTERWKAVEGHEGYQVSTGGKVVSMRRLKELRQDTTGSYRRVTVCKDAKTSRYLVHRLVAIAFIDNPQALPMVNHKDGNKSNNTVSNLEWCTCQENTVHAFDTGLRAHGERSTNAKLTDAQVKEVCKLIEEGHVRGYILRQCTHVSKYTFDDIRRRKTWIRVSRDYTW